MATDAFFNNTVLLLHCDDVGLTDVKGHTTTLNGNAARSATQSKFGGYSAAFDGTGDYLNFSNSADWAFADGAFTIEAWVRLNALPSAGIVQAITGRWNTTGSQGFYFGVYNNAGTYYLYLPFYNGTTTVEVMAAWSAPAIDTWYHVAVVRSGSTAKFFVNGTQISTDQTMSGSIASITAELWVGGVQNTTHNYFNGYIDDLRITKGIARYTGPFAVPTAAFPDAAPTDHDPFWNQAVLAMAMDDTGLTDAKSHSLTLNGNVARSATQSKFGGFSAVGDGNGDYISLPSSNDWVFGTSDFTIEGWVYPAGLNAQSAGGSPLLNNQSTTNHFNFYMSSTTAAVVIFNNTNVITGITMTASAWQHVAIVRSGANLMVFVNGVQQGSTYNIGTNAIGTTTANYLMGMTTGHWFNGYVDDVRITKAARYTTNFTAPAVANPTSFNETYDPWLGNVVLLQHMDDTGLTDVKGHTVTLNGNAARSATQSKFGGYSATLDGTGDYLEVPDSTDWDFAGDFTIEFWCRTSVPSQVRTMLSNYDTTTTGWSFQSLATSKVGFNLTGDGVDLTSTTSIPADTWVHIAVVRSGSTCTLFFNGAAEATMTSSAATTSTKPLFIGRLNNTYPSVDWNGYIDDVRITKGVARYQIGFTVPAVAFADTDVYSDGAFIGAAAAVASATGQVVVDAPIAGAAQAQAGATGQLAIDIPVAGGAAAEAGAAGLPTPPFVQGAAAGQAAATGQVLVQDFVSGAATGQSAATGVLSFILNPKVILAVQVYGTVNLSASLSIAVQPRTLDLLALLTVDVHPAAFSLSAPLEIVKYSPTTNPPAATVPNLEKYISRWSAKVTINALDVTSSLTGTATVDIEEGSARVARFSLKPSFGEIHPETLLNSRVKISYIQVPIESGSNVETPVFKGFIDTIAYDPSTGVTSFTCSDLLQHRFDKMTRGEVDAILTSTTWSSVVFGDPVLSSEYARQRVSTVPASMDMSVNGNIRLTSWTNYPVVETFDETHVIDGSLNISLASVRDLTNYVVVDVGFRYSRICEWREHYGWNFFTPGGRSLVANIEWRDVLNYGIPVMTDTVIKQAVASTDWNYWSYPTFTYAPEVVDLTNLGIGVGGIISNPVGTVTMASFTLCKRWVQSADEQVQVVVRAPGPLATLPRIVENQSFSQEADLSLSYFGQHYEDLRPTDLALFAAGSSSAEGAGGTAITSAVNMSENDPPRMYWYSMPSGSQLSGSVVYYDVDQDRVVNLLAGEDPVTSSGLSYTLTDLHPNTEYTFSVYARSATDTPVVIDVLMRDNSSAPANSDPGTAMLYPVTIETARTVNAVAQRISISLTTGWNGSQVSITLTAPTTARIYWERMMFNLGTLTSYYAAQSPTFRELHEEATGVAVSVAKTSLINAHRGNSVSFRTLCSPYLDVTQGLTLDTPRVQATGKIKQITHTFDVSAGSAVTDITLALIRAPADGADTSLTMPGKLPQFSDPVEGGAGGGTQTSKAALNTYIGKLPGQYSVWDFKYEGGEVTTLKHAPLYGMVCNAVGSAASDPYAAVYEFAGEGRFVVYTRQIPRKFTDASVAGAAATVDVRIPSDPLTITA